MCRHRALPESRKYERVRKRGACGGKTYMGGGGEEREEGGLNFKKPLTHAAAGPDHSTDAFVHFFLLSLFLSYSFTLIPCVFGDMRRVQISKSHCL